MLRAVAILAALLTTTAAHAQESTHYKTWPESLRQQAPIPPGWQVTATVSPNPLAGLQPVPPMALGKPEPVVMYGGMGGHIGEHLLRFKQLGASGAVVEMRGGCWSACTLITGYVPKDRLCFGPDSFLAFHAAQTADHRLSINDTWMMYWALPVQMQNWLDAYGGPLKMTVNNYWFLRDIDLWKMGYPKCK